MKRTLDPINPRLLTQDATTAPIKKAKKRKKKRDTQKASRKKNRK